MTTNDIVQKLWKLCDVLRDDGINYSNYVTELVLLLFIKMEYENKEAGILRQHKLPKGCRWPDLTAKSGVTLLNEYKRILLILSTGKETQIDPEDDSKTIEKEVVTDRLIIAIYAEAQTSLREPRHLEQLIKSLDAIDWFSAQKDGLGDLYEGLLEKNASETKSGAGQYFTPRALIDSIINCIKPQPGEVIQDPAAGTAGFLVASDAYMRNQTDDYIDLTANKAKFQKTKAFIGMELVPNTRRLALMNCLLHGMDGEEEGVVLLGNTLGTPGTSLARADLILTNPPFGTAKGGGGPTRDDFTFKTSNKQLAFLQHIYRSLKPGGRAAVVLPDNVLFEEGVGTKIRTDLMDKCNLHTVLRLPTGIFYAQGVKTNVLFFTRGKTDTGNTKAVWFYDMRTNMPQFGKRTPLTLAHFAGFEKSYGKKADGTSKRKEETEDGKGEESRFRCFTRDDLEKRGDNLDISWLKDEDAQSGEDLEEPDVIAAMIRERLDEALGEMDALGELLRD